MRYFLAALIICCVILSASALATTYYVDDDRPDNSGDGLSLGNAWKNISYAATQAAAGDLILVATGEYNATTGESFPITIPASAELRALDTYTATVEAATAKIFNLSLWSTLEGFYITGPGNTSNYDGAIYLNGENCRVLTNILSCSASTTRGIYIPGGAEYSRIIGNTIYMYNTSTRAIVSSDSWQTSNLTISSNIIRTGPSSSGIFLDREAITTVSYNTIEVGAGGSGIEWGTYSSDGLVKYNWVIGSGGGIGIDFGYHYNGSSIMSNEVTGFGIGIDGGLYNQISGSYTQPIMHNTVVDCDTGIKCYSRSGDPDNYFIIKNNVVVATKTMGDTKAGSIGIDRLYGDVNATYNDVWNFAIPYYDESPGTSPSLSESNNISRYPRFVDPDNGDYRLTSNSPCVTAGEGGTYQGRYPSSGIASTVSAESWVDDDAVDDSGPGDFDHPWKKISTALASTEYVVHVKAGTYNDALEGAFPLSISQNQRLSSEAGTSAIIDTTNYTAVRMTYGTTIEGFMVKTSTGNADNGAIHLYSSAEVLTNTISCSATNSRGIFLATDADSSYLANNTMTMMGDNSRGIMVYNSCNYVTIEANTIEVNGAGSTNYGIYFWTNSDYAVIKDNHISAGTNCDGIYFYDQVSDFSVMNNVIRGIGDVNNAGIHLRSYVANGTLSFNDISDFGYGIYVEDLDGTLDVINNTIYDCSVYGIWSSWDGTMNVYNNIIARSTMGGTYGIYHDYSGGAVNSSYDDIWNYSTPISNYVTTGVGTKSVDPRFVNAAADDYHLDYNSPCIDAGSPEGSTFIDMGAYPFTGTMGVYVIQPNGGETITGYDNYNIQWYATIETGSFDHIEIYLSTDEGSTYPYAVATNEANDGSYSWEVTNIPTNGARIKVIAVGSAVTDESDGDFTILNGDTDPPTVEVIVPSNGLSWPGGSSRNIIFTCSDIRGVKVNSADLYYNTGEGWVSIDTDQPTNSAYAWTVPLFNTTEAKVRVTAEDVNNNVGTGESTGYFIIDSTSPSATSIILRDLSSGSTIETNSLTVSVEALGVSDSPALMRLAENSGFTVNSTGWISYANPTAFTFTWGNGTREVYYQLRDTASNESPVYGDSIIVDISIYYVDAVSGSNSNTGTDETDAWKTITYALSTTEANDIIMCSAGTYDATNGETFPLTIEAAKLVSGESAAVCFIKGGGSPPVILRGGGEIKNFTILSTSLTIGDAVIMVDGVGYVTGNNISYVGTPPTEAIGVLYDSGSSGTASYNTIYGMSTGVKLDTSGSVTADHNTIASFNEYGVWMDKGDYTLTNNIVSASPVLNELADDGATALYNVGASVTEDYNDLWGNDKNYENVTAGSNTLNKFAYFVDPDNNDYRIYDSTAYASSPLKDAGSDGATIGALTNVVGGSVYRDTAYVDAVNGSDSTSKGFDTTTDAYRTLTYANQYAVEVINAADGDYDLLSDSLNLTEGKTLQGTGLTIDDVNIVGTSGELINMADGSKVDNVAIISNSPVPAATIINIKGDDAIVEDTNLSFTATAPSDSRLVTVNDGVDNTRVITSTLQGADYGIVANSPVESDKNTIVDFNDTGIYFDHVGELSTIKNTTIVQKPDPNQSPDPNTYGIYVNDGTAELQYDGFFNNAQDLGSAPAGTITNLGEMVYREPQFYDVDANNFTLKKNSPLIGAGENGETIGAWQPDYSASGWIACHITTPDGGETLGVNNIYAVSGYASMGATPIEKIDLYYSTDGGATFPNIIAEGLTNTGGTNSAQTVLYAWTVPNVETDEARVRIVATVGSSYSQDDSDANFTISRSGENIPPDIGLRVAGFTVITGDYIDRDTTFDVYLTDNVSLDVSATRIRLDGTMVSYTTDYDLGASAKVSHRAASLAEGLHAITIEAFDTSGNIATREALNLIVEYGAAKVIGPILVNPTPFSPIRDNNAKIAYHLNKNVATTLYIYGPSGLFITRKFLAGQNGGKAGYNEPPTTGISDVGQAYLGNGIYVIQIVAEGRAIGKGHLVIYD